MRNIYDILIVPALILLAAGCAPDVKYTAGEKENPDTYGVYFPLQDNSLAVELAPQQETTVTYKVRRMRTEGTINVPYNLVSSEEGIFTASDIVFEDGESETDLTFSFPDAEVGTTYTCSVTIDDPDYISVYGKKSTGLSFTVLRASWELLGTGLWRDDIISSMYGAETPNAEVEVDIYQRSDKPGYLRMKVFTSDFLNALFGATRPTEELLTIVDATDPEKVWIPKQSTGITLNTDDGFITIASYVDKQFSIDAADSQYGKLVEGVISFPASSIMANLSKYMAADEWYPVNSSGLQRIVLPGGHVYDYSLSLTKGTSAEGPVPVEVKMGADIVKVKYAFFEGRLDEGQVSLKAQSLDEGDIAFEQVEIAESGTVNFTMEETGIYTMVGCGYDASGNMQAFDYAVFGYVKEGDSRPVILTIGLEGTNELAGQGISTDNAAKFYAYGEGIESIVYGLYRKNKISSVTDYDELLDTSGSKMRQESVDLINEKSFRTMLTGLNGDSEYVMVLRADNGYGRKIFTAEYKTTGKFNPVYEDYGYDDFFAAIQTLKKDLVATDWNYYAVNLVSASMDRKYLGKVKIEDDPADASDVDYLTVTGLAGVEFDDGPSVMQAAYVSGSTALQGYFGTFVPLLDQDPIGTYNGEEIFCGYIPEEDTNSIYMTAGMFAGTVAEGYIAFVPSPVLSSQGYNFSFFFIGSQSTLVGLYMDMMLVDSSKDVGVIPAVVEHKLSLMEEAALRAATRCNFVELPEKADRFGNALRDVVEQDRGTILNLAREAGVETAPVTRTVRAESVILN